MNDIDTVEDLGAAATALDALARGARPSAVHAFPGYQAIEWWIDSVPQEHRRDLLDAAAGLKSLALGEPLELDQDGLERAGRLAELVRRIAEDIEAYVL